MKFPLKVALRYVFTKKKTNAINIISGISLTAFSICAAAMLIIFSALNGFEKTITLMFTAFDPDIKIETIEGKTFNPEKIIGKLKKIEGISSIALTLEDNAVMKYGQSQEITVIKGVSENYSNVTGIDSLVFEGKYDINNDNYSSGVFGYELSEKLGLNLNNPLGFVTVYVPVKGDISNINPEQNIITEKILPTAKFYVHEDIDSRYVLVSLDFAQKIFSSANKISAIEIKLKKNYKSKVVKNNIRKIAGTKFSVKNKYEQKESFYKIFKSEKLVTIAILSFILLIASFNLMGSVTMLILEKQKDIRILRSIGIYNSSLSKIFINSGLIIAFTGCAIGLILGSILVFIQEKFGLLRLENSLIDAYPVSFKIQDFFIIIFISMIIGFVTSWIPSRKLN
ncbi:MAG: ABC transporter permease [Bacteroidia bacterium]|nr:ABC transporter permease [Bacteroidia bacterium]